MHHTRLLVSSAIALVLGAIGVSGLMRAGAGLARSVTLVRGVPVELITPARDPRGPWPGVVVVHGFAGSRQLMYGIAQTLARNGYAAAVVDLPGHGQNRERMPMRAGRAPGPDDPLAKVAAWLRTQPGVDGSRIALVGHSMGAGAVIRAASRDAGIGATVAISIGLGPRGPVAADVPRNVLAMAGGWEFRNVLDACRAAVTASYPGANPSVRQGSWAAGTARQCIVVPGVEHIAVLFKRSAAIDITRWLDGALDAYPLARPIRTAIPMGPASWLHAAGAALFFLLAEMLFPRGRTDTAATTGSATTPAPLSRLALATVVAGSAVLAAIVMRFVPSGWAPLVTADHLCGFFLLMGLGVIAGLAGLGRLVVPAGASSGLAWRTLVLVTVAVVPFAVVAQASWLNLVLVGPRRWLVVGIFPVWLVYFLAADSLFRTRPARGYFLAWASSTLLTIAVLLAAVFLLRAPFFLLLLAPALLPMFLWLGLYGHWLRHRTESPWPTACVGAALFAWLTAAVFPLV